MVALKSTNRNASLLKWPIKGMISFYLESVSTNLCYQFLINYVFSILHSIFSFRRDCYLIILGKWKCFHWMESLTNVTFQVCRLRKSIINEREYFARISVITASTNLVSCWASPTNIVTMSQSILTWSLSVERQPSQEISIKSTRRAREVDSGVIGV